MKETDEFETGIMYSFPDSLCTVYSVSLQYVNTKS